MAKVAIFGGHGKVALRLARLLAEQGDEVTSYFRRPEHQDEVAATGARAEVLDLESSAVDRLAEVIGGHDVVVWSAGAGGGDPDRTYAVDRDAAVRSIDAAEATTTRRYVMVSYLGSGPDHGVPEDDPFFPYADAKAAADEHLRASSLDWTVLGPGRLTDDAGTGRIRVVHSRGERDDVPRDDVAAVVAAVLADPTTVRRTIGFVGGDDPIGQAVRQA